MFITWQPHENIKLRLDSDTKIYEFGDAQSLESTTLECCLDMIR